MLFGSVSAVAASHYAALVGSEAYSNGSVIYSADTACDNKGTRANYSTVGGHTGGVSNHSGCKTTVSKNAGKTITAVQACISRGIGPMACTSWNNRW